MGAGVCGGAGASVNARDCADSSVSGLAADPSVRRALDFARGTEQDTIREQIRLCEIPAPPFGEAMRAAAYAESMRAAGLTNVRIDSAGNVLGERPGRSRKPHLVLSAHLDTVFPADYQLSVTRDKNWLRGPGIGDDCRGFAVVLAVARALDAAKVQTEGPITFVGTVGEEGLGDLRGVKALYASTLREQSHRFVSVDGDGYAITNVGIGSRRYRVTFRGPGGHSYDNFGRANPVNAVGLAIAPLSPSRSSGRAPHDIRVGRIGGGTSINAIAERGLDGSGPSFGRRGRALATRRRISGVSASRPRRGKQSAEEPRSTHRCNRHGGGSSCGTYRSAGRRVVETAVAILRALGLPVRFVEGSTDANLPMSVGIPSIAIGGGGVGRDAHSPRESFDTTESWKGTQLVTLLAVALVDSSLLPVRHPQFDRPIALQIYGALPCGGSSRADQPHQKGGVHHADHDQLQRGRREENRRKQIQDGGEGKYHCEQRVDSASGQCGTN